MQFTDVCGGQAWATGMNAEDSQEKKRAWANKEHYSVGDQSKEILT